jgi:hypothetical protein
LIKPPGISTGAYVKVVSAGHIKKLYQAVIPRGHIDRLHQQVISRIGVNVCRDNMFAKGCGTSLDEKRSCCIRAAALTILWRVDRDDAARGADQRPPTIQGMSATSGYYNEN